MHNGNPNPTPLRNAKGVDTHRVNGGLDDSGFDITDIKTITDKENWVDSVGILRKPWR